MGYPKNIEAEGNKGLKNEERREKIRKNSFNGTHQ